MTTRPDDELDQYLVRRSRLSPEYRALGAEEPPPAVDARVLAEAGRAIEKKARPARWPARRWLVPVALAATVVLSFSLLLRMGEVPAPARRTTAEPAAPPVAVRASPPQSEVPDTVPESVTNELPAQLAQEERPSSPAVPPPQVAVTTTVESPEKSSFAASPAREEFLARGLRSAMARQDLEAAAVLAETSRALAAPSAPGEFEPVMAAIRARLDPAEGKVAPAPPEPVATLAADRDAEGRLREIVRLYEAGDEAGASAAFALFERDYPEDPLSMQFGVQTAPK